MNTYAQFFILFLLLLWRGNILWSKYFFHKTGPRIFLCFCFLSKHFLVNSQGKTSKCNLFWKSSKVYYVLLGLIVDLITNNNLSLARAKRLLLFTGILNIINIFRKTIFWVLLFKGRRSLNIDLNNQVYVRCSRKATLCYMSIITRVKIEIRKIALLFLKCQPWAHTENRLAFYNLAIIVIFL